MGILRQDARGSAVTSGLEAQLPAACEVTATSVSGIPNSGRYVYLQA